MLTLMKQLSTVFVPRFVFDTTWHFLAKLNRYVGENIAWEKTPIFVLRFFTGNNTAGILSIDYSRNKI